MRRSETKRIALCGMMAALSTVILLMGAVLGLGIYLAPMVAGMILLPVGRSFGWKYHGMLWLVVSVLAFLLVSEIEENLMYLCLFGCYPILYPKLCGLPKGVRTLTKLVLFNGAFLLVELLVMWVLVPQAVELWYLVVLLLLGNVMFLCYDRALPVAAFWMDRYLGRLFQKL